MVSSTPDHSLAKNDADNIENEASELFSFEKASDNGAVAGKHRSEASSDLPKKSVAVASVNVFYTKLFLILLVDLLAFTCILPLFPSILTYYSKDGRDWLYDGMETCANRAIKFILPSATMSPATNTVLFGGSVFSLLQFCSSPIIGALSDKHGRKTMLLATSIGICGSYIMWAVAGKFRYFVLARVIGGISKGNVGLCTAMVTDVSDSKQRGKGMALIGIAFSLGFLLGPSIGASMLAYSKSNASATAAVVAGGNAFVYPALFAVVLAAIDILMIVFMLDETLTPESRAVAVSQSAPIDLKQFLNPLALFRYAPLAKSASIADVDAQADIRRMRRLGLLQFAFVFITSGPELTMPFLTQSRFGYDGAKQGRMFFYIGVLMILMQGGYVRRVHPGYERKCAVRGLLSAIVAFILIGVAHTQWLFYVALVFYCFASASVVTCLNTMVSRCGLATEKGAVMGITRSLNAFGRAFGPAFASTLFWLFGPTTMYIVCGLLMIIPLIIMPSVPPPIHRVGNPTAAAAAAAVVGRHLSPPRRPLYVRNTSFMFDADEDKKDMEDMAARARKAS